MRSVCNRSIGGEIRDQSLGRIYIMGITPTVGTTPIRSARKLSQPRTTLSPVRWTHP